MLKRKMNNDNDEWVRATFIVRKKTLQDLKDYVYIERLTQKEAVDKALTEYLKGKPVLNRK